MQNIYEQIKELEHIQGLSKHEQLVQGIINAINDKLIARGDMLPSVNSLIKELGFARETIAKGYKELISRGIVESKNRIGFFVANESTENVLRIVLVIFAFDSFQEIFYKTFRDRLGKRAHIDIFFHHNNIDVFESIISTVRGKYGMYVVAPIPHKRTAAILNTLPLNKFLMIDRYQELAGDFSYVVQEFGESSYRAFAELAPAIRSFKGMIHYHRPASDTPIEIIEAYKRFIKDYQINSVIRTEYIPGSIEKGFVYFTINNAELWQMLKDAKAKGYKLGRDVGILSHNDEIVKEIIFDGITTYSTDFSKMAEKSAEFVAKRKPIREVIPTVLLRRGSL
ncbi:MAG: GntR family transcriptional regulator [Sphingobacteriales bacterium]|jgi:DNA-binding LacI/PurR family transcriptional regulator|nr:GntR family transcriptional regulator [Sphingobacteriales bacterium]NCT74137.1 GntR family transcriptional regulator [Chitinophagaceae bacterium]OJW34142.1 MAG: GntR family transcriptional regulator [Sphingobacteriales bacterium 46-32]